MARIVLDASASLAYLKEESGCEVLTPEVLEDSLMSSVNLAEVQTVLIREGMYPEHAWEDALSIVGTVEPFTQEQAKLAGSLIAQTQPLGLSLGDRACLALALILSAPVYTADRIWARLNIGCRIHVIR